VDGTKLDIEPCASGVNQEFTMTAAGAILTYDTKCVDGYQQGTSPGTVVDMFTCNGGSNQRWEWRPNGTITNAESVLCLDVLNQSTSSGGRVDEYTCNGGANQEWTRRWLAAHLGHLRRR
jgi:hypothetical protein